MELIDVRYVFMREGGVMYVLKPEARQWEPIAGVPWRDMEDAEFAAVSERYDAQFPDQPGSLLRWFEFEPVPQEDGGREVSDGFNA